MLTWSNNNLMKQIFRAAIILLASLLFAAPSMATGMVVTISWQELTPQQQQILAPLANDWGTLSKKQQNTFIGIAKRYPQLTPLQQQRLQERMVKWSKLTPAQRQQAREKFQSVKKLPPEKRGVEIQSLREKHAKKYPYATSSVQPASPKP
jgi:hypothetical protein